MGRTNFDDHFDEMMQDPEFAAAYHKREAEGEEIKALLKEPEVPNFHLFEYNQPPLSQQIAGLKAETVREGFVVFLDAWRRYEKSFTGRLTPRVEILRMYLAGPAVKLWERHCGVNIGAEMLAEQEALDAQEAEIAKRAIQKNWSDL